MVQAVCLSDAEILHYLNGETSEAESSRIENHLNACPACESLAADLEARGDWVTRHLRLNPDTTIPDELSIVEIEKLREIPIRSIANSDRRIPSLPNPTAQRSVYHYRLGSEIGRGGMGVVYRSEHPQLHRPVAVKLLSASHADEAAAIARFQREMRAAGVLDHPGIVRALDAGSWHGTYYFVMEYIDGTDLSRLTQRIGPLRVADACALIVEAAEALQYAHDHRVLHRDIKPSNLILTQEGKLKVLDFGLARLDQGTFGGTEMTTTGRLVGTLDYASPEQASGEVAVDERGDLYGLGATLYRLLTGRPPHGFSAQRPLLQYLKELTEGAAPPITEFRRDIPHELGQLVATLVAREPHQRPSTAAKVAEQLRPFAQSADLTELARQAIQNRPSDDADGPKTHEPRLSVAPAPRRKYRWIPVLLTMLLGCGLGLAGMTFWLKTGSGLIRVESDVDGVSLKLVEVGGSTESIEVHRGEETTRVNVGQYELRLDGDVDSVRIDTANITLLRGETRLVRITREESAKTVSNSDKNLPARIAEHFKKLEAAWKSSESTLGTDHPTTIAARNQWMAAKNDALRAVTGEAADSKTSRGRTYRQWTDIVLRETNPETIVEGIQALVDLSTEDTSRQTHATLERISSWNDSRDPNPASDNYIGFFHVPPKPPVPSDPRGIRSRPSETAKSSKRRAWESVYGKPNPDWSLVTRAILDAQLELQQVLDSDNWAQDASPVSHNISLALIATQEGDPSPADIDFVKTMLSEKANTHTRAIANHVWLKYLNQAPDSVLKPNVLTEPMPIQKAILNTALIEDRVAQGRILGEMYADLITKDVPLHHRSIYETLVSSFEDRPVFLNSESGAMILAIASGLTLRLQESPELIATSLQSQELLRHLSYADLLYADLRRQASNGIHAIIKEQVHKRTLLAHPIPEEEFLQLPILFSAMTAATLDGQIPPVLENAPIPDALQDGVLDPSNREQLFQWLMLFPVKTTRSILETCEFQIKDAIASDNPRTRVREIGAALDLVRNVDPTFALIVALSEPEDKCPVHAIDLILNQLESQELSITRLSLPLGALSDRLFELAEHNAIPQRQGFLLRLAQLGGANEAKLLAITRRILQSDSVESANITFGEFSWLLQVLSNCNSNQLDQMEFEQCVTRVFLQHFPARDLLALHQSDSTALHRSILACFRIREQTEFGDPTDLLLRYMLGIEGKSNRDSRRNRGGEGVWGILCRGFPEEIVRPMLTSIVKKPPADPVVLKALKEKDRVLSRLSRTQEPVSLLNDAIRKIEAELNE